MTDTQSGSKGNNDLAMQPPVDDSSAGGKVRVKSSRAQTLRQRKQVLKQLRKLTPVFQRTGTYQTGLFREPGMLDYTSSNVTLEAMMAAGVHLGHSASLWNPLNLPYIFGEREGIHIINLEKTIAALRRAAHLVNKVAYNGGIILFTGVRKDHRQLAIDAALHADQYYFARKWIAGTLTNSESVLGRNSSYTSDTWDVEEARDFANYETASEKAKRADLSGSQARYMKMVKEEKAKMEAEKEGRAKPYKPDLVVALNPLESRTMLVESRLSFIPTVGIVDTNCDPRKVTYPIPCNDDSLRAVTIVAGVLARAARDGLELRRQRLKDAVDAHSNAEINRATTKSQRPESLKGEEAS
ncbi:hypothetical protein IW140_004650 [Coemansia sp. RSA 1813]|nr:hypothetical protein EV178_004715 [Coemansia sp. RSA 1646]KAJ2087628.1 hypothetical protein IW138_004831 [Coemansia sp. RSA 986]KAJ2214372.1 hypothetical protein EV179_003037 [Coemansia sp. RSA 487]KAJ2567083.1 hypothetical protein IW140_004650 [Coemansia sp. RSA 1813]